MKTYPPNFFVIRHVKILYAFVLLQLYGKGALFHTPRIQKTATPFWDKPEAKRRIRGVAKFNAF